MPKFVDRRWFHPLLLLVWVLVGAGLRFTHLAAKPLWSDEISTLVFSLGNSVRALPLDQAIDLNRLLLPLQPHPTATLGDVIRYLTTESNHPPAYFLLNHLWLKLFPVQDGLVSVWAARSLPVLFGIMAIPASFGLGWVAFRSRLVGQLAAMLMAVSPFGIYLAQEVRHYTLAILLMIASLSCLVVAVRGLVDRTPISLPLCLVWIVVNGCGIAVHFFVALTLAAEALVLLSLAGWQLATQRRLHPTWWRIGAVFAATAIGGLVWLPTWQNIPDSGLTKWIYKSDPVNKWLGSPLRLVVWLVSMVTLLPVESRQLPVAIVSAILLISFLIWLLPTLIPALRRLSQSFPASMLALGGFGLAAIGLFLAIAYGIGADLTVAARYHFVYFPAVIVLLGAALAVCWQPSLLTTEAERSPQLDSMKSKFKGKQIVVGVALMGAISGGLVVTNQVFQKPHRADLLAAEISQTSPVPVLVAMTNGNDLRFREMIALGYEFNRNPLAATLTPRFLLATVRPDPAMAIVTLERTIAQLPLPLDVWTVNYTPDQVRGCQIDRQHSASVNGYKYRRFRCR